MRRRTVPSEQDVLRAASTTDIQAMNATPLQRLFVLSATPMDPAVISRSRMLRQRRRVVLRAVRSGSSADGGPTSTFRETPIWDRADARSP